MQPFLTETVKVNTEEIEQMHHYRFKILILDVIITLMELS